jgi:ankyrin repeat protein
MFPNPQDALPLPSRPNLEQYKKLAKELVKASKSGQPEAVRAWAAQWIGRLARLRGPALVRPSSVRLESWVEQVEGFARRKLTNAQPGSTKGTLADAQFVIARAHGFLSWPRLRTHIEALGQASNPVAQFESAAEAVVTGNVRTLARLLHDNPKLIEARSTREHRATLLHYVSANGVESYRQKTPKNAARVAEMLLQAGAEVDAEADVYGGGATTLGLVATSAHPRKAGVQNALLQVLLDHGAAIEQAQAAGNAQSAVQGALANGCPEAAEFLAQRGAHVGLEEAAGIGRLDLVQTFFHPDGRLRASQKQLDAGFGWACLYGRTSVVEFLLDKGVDLRAQSYGQTALHWAVIGGQIDIIRLLLARGAPLEEKNTYGGTVLGQTLWSAVHGGARMDYVPIIEILIDAGAKIEPGSLAWLAQQKGRSATAKKRLTDLLRRHGATT